MRGVHRLRSVGLKPHSEFRHSSQPLIAPSQIINQRRASPDISLSNAAASERIQWTLHATAALIQYTRVN
ncbi:MAG: hypothetical protein M0Q15_02000, partial [Nevskia sp.]|nr:hypothetical protein [Nevskia sp.]